MYKRQARECARGRGRRTARAGADRAAAASDVRRRSDHRRARPARGAYGHLVRADRATRPARADRGAPGERERRRGQPEILPREAVPDRVRSGLDAARGLQRLPARGHRQMGEAHSRDGHSRDRMITPPFANLEQKTRWQSERLDSKLGPTARRSRSP